MLFADLMRKPSDKEKKLLDCVEAEKAAKSSIK
jgi:hypothetical protein